MNVSNGQKTGMRGSAAPQLTRAGIAFIAVTLTFLLVAILFFTLRNNLETESILKESVRGELIASCIAARELIEPHLELFERIQSQADIDANKTEWSEVVSMLRGLNEEIGSAYIYALKEIDGQYYFIFDTDEEAEEAHLSFDAYELGSVHQLAFAGETAADVMNINDQWGSFNTGAVPLYHEGTQVGIVSVDLSDVYLERNRSASSFNAIALAVSVCSALTLMVIILTWVLARNRRMQDNLFRLANYDGLTGLPNRYHLFSYLKEENERLLQRGTVFAVYFIDIDNFKQVNDHAGHDAGDELLRQIAGFFEEFTEEAAQSGAARFVDSMTTLTARIGGDEFLQLVPGQETAEQVSAYAQAMLEAFARQPGLQDYIKNYNVGISIGVALFPRMESHYDELIKYADIAMYYAKSGGKNNYCLYHQDMGHDVEGAKLIVRHNSDEDSTATREQPVREKRQ